MAAATTPSSPFVSVPIRSRFFQSSAFFPMPIVLLATRATDGSVNLAPYSLCFPHITSEGHRLVLVTRSASKTSENIARSGRVAVNFIPDEPIFLENMKLLAAPIPAAEKMKQSIFTLVPSDAPAGTDGLAPPLVAEAVQVFECRVVSAEVPADDSAERRFVLEVERINMPPRWAKALEAGRGGPRLPIDYGFRRGTLGGSEGRWSSLPSALLSGPRVRPAFEIPVTRSPVEVKADFTEALSRPRAPVSGKMRDDVVQITMPKDQLKLFSPHVDLRVDPRPDGTGSIVRGRIGPQPQVWTTFMFIHLLILFSGIGGLMWGISQALSGGSPWAIWAVPIALFLHAFVAGAAFIGQGLAVDQTFRLRRFLDDVLGE